MGAILHSSAGLFGRVIGTTSLGLYLVGLKIAGARDQCGASRSLTRILSGAIA
jgi:hypothetical protein